MTLEAVVSLATSAVALVTAIWAHRRILPKPKAPVTKEELYDAPPPTTGGQP